MNILFFNILITILKRNWFLLSSYVLYFMYSKALFWKGVHRLFTRLPKVSMTPGYSLLTVPRKTLGRIWRWEIQRWCLSHTHTQILTEWWGHFPWNQSPCRVLARQFSEHLEEWKPLLTHGKDTASFKPEKHDLLPACFQFQAMPWKGQLIRMFRKRRS